MKATALKKFLEILGIMGYLLLSAFSGITAGLAICAFLSIFNGNVVFGIFGTVAAGFLAWMFWEIRKSTLI